MYPDFQTGGMADVSNYQDGRRGGKIKVRAILEEFDKKSVVIKDVPFGETVSSLIDSITRAAESKKIPVKKVTDITAAEVQVLVELNPGTSIDIAIDALYAFTNCEVSVSPNACVIEDRKPAFRGVSELLKSSADHTRNLLKQELEIRLKELNDKWHYTSLEKIFFEEKIYKELEKKHETWEKVLTSIEKAFKPFLPQLHHPVTREDVLKLTEKPVRRIYRLDIDELIRQIKGIEEEIATVEHHLAHLTDYAIAYFEKLITGFGKGRERKTQIRLFDSIQAQQVAVANQKLYVNRSEGFVGTGLKREEYVTDCSDIDDIICITKRGIMKIVRVADKVFIGKDIIHVAVFDKTDSRTTYNLIYADGKSGVTYAKRFQVGGITRDKEYDLTKGSDKSKVHYLSVNPNGEAEVVRISLSPSSKARIKELEYYFEELSIKSRGSQGNQVTKYPVRSVKFKEAGRSTLEGRKLWYDNQFGRLNTDEKGDYLGMFEGDDLIIAIYNDGTYEITDQELMQRFDTDKLLLIELFDPEAIITAVYLDKEKDQYNIKRFRIETSTLKTPFQFIKDGPGNYLEMVTTDESPSILIEKGRGASKESEIVQAEGVVDLMGWKAVGSKLAVRKSVELSWVSNDTGAVQGELF